MGAIPFAIWVLLLAPLAALTAGFFVFHGYRPSRTHWPMLASCIAVCAASLWLLLKVRAGARWDLPIFHWLVAGGFDVDFGVRMDGLTASVLAMVALVGTLIHVYAVEYMRDDPEFSRFFLYFHFFFFSMIGLLISDNYLQMYVFWEGVGLASFLLIGFWHGRARARAAAWKAFLVNRVGDAGFLLAALLLLSRLGTVRFNDVFGMLGSESPRFFSVVALLLFWGACAKSAQFPLHIWLPDAMEGPTPVSALMHAATMVAAGVFLMARSMPLLEAAFPEVRHLIAWTGAGTALGAAVIASMKVDLKRILAYSTISHLGLMMLAIGMGSVYAAVFHLIAHGFFKALLFLCAGNVIHGTGSSGSVGVPEVGGLYPRLPRTAVAFAIGAASLAGFPPSAGFYSKDAVIDSVFGGGGPALRWAALLIVVGSSFYIFRMLFLTFFGRRAEQRGLEGDAHEAVGWMLWPVRALAVFALAAGVIGPSGALAGFLGADAPHPSFRLMGLGVLAASAGLGLAWLATSVWTGWDWAWRKSCPRLEAWLDGELGWQSFMSRLAALGERSASWIAEGWDRRRWDAWTQSLADSCVGLGEGLGGLSRGILNEYIWWMLAASVVLTSVVARCI